MSPSSRIVIWLAFGTQGNHFDSGPVSFSLPSSASCRIRVAAKVLVSEPIRVRSSTLGFALAPLRLVPRVAVQPWPSAQTPTIAPGETVLPKDESSALVSCVCTAAGNGLGAGAGPGA